MIYEVRTTDLKPRSLPEVERRFELAYHSRRRHSELAAFWHSEIGPLNQIVEVWAYDSLAHRSAVLAAAATETEWPPRIAEFVLRERAEIMHPASFSPTFGEGCGPFFEYRTYTYPAGTLPRIMQAWEHALPVRLQFGPVTAIWHAEFGTTNSFVHIWPYRSLAEREEIRAKVRQTGMWPPFLKDLEEGGAGYDILSQESKLLLPASFSPLR
ncbi:MAG: NIPSNAP family protein [Pseudomonadota bacterium]